MINVETNTTNALNYDVYNASMVKSAYDKLYFVDKVFDIDTIVDFGCADGAVTELIKFFFRNATVIGYDLYQENETNDRVIYTQDLNEVKRLIKGKKTLLVMNSVVHEIYNYEDEPFEFLKDLFSLDFKYIFIRDLFITGKIDFTSIFTEIPRVTDILNAKYHDKVQDFEKIYGSITNTKNFIHFLQKFRYTANWKHEVEEDYTLFAEYYEKMAVILHDCGYTAEVNQQYVLPYIQDITMRDFGFNLIRNKCVTHFRGLYKKETK